MLKYITNKNRKYLSICSLNVVFFCLFGCCSSNYQNYDTESTIHIYLLSLNPPAIDHTHNHHSLDTGWHMVQCCQWLLLCRVMLSCDPVTHNEKCLFGIRCVTTVCSVSWRVDVPHSCVRCKVINDYCSDESTGVPHTAVSRPSILCPYNKMMEYRKMVQQTFLEKAACLIRSG